MLELQYFSAGWFIIYLLIIADLFLNCFYLPLSGRVVTAHQESKKPFSSVLIGILPVLADCIHIFVELQAVLLECVMDHGG
jgi:hypothetical protein